MIKDCHVGVKGLVVAHDKCLILQRGIGDEAFWDVPGGRIDDTETLTDTLTRELKEELPSIGRFTIGDIIGAYRLDHDIQGERALVLIFYKVSVDDFEVALSDEHSDYKWVTREDVEGIDEDMVSITPQLREFLKKVL